MNMYAAGAIGLFAFIVATIIDHLMGIACPNVIKVGVKSWQLFLHKLMYVGIGLWIMYLHTH
jgi:hypothetical protein